MSQLVFDIFRDGSSDEDSVGDGDGGAATAARAPTAPPTAPPTLGTRHLLLDPAPPLPASVLGPRPVNLTVNPSLAAREHRKPPIESVPWTLLGPNKDTVASEEQRQPRALQRLQPRREAPAAPTLITSREDEHAARLADEVARLEAETDRIIAEQKKLDLARLQAQLVTPPPKPKRSLLKLDKLAFLSKSRPRRSNASSYTNSNSNSNANSSQPGTPSTLAPSVFSPTLSHFSSCSSIDDSALPVRMSFIQPGGKGSVPQVDAPTSAINGGDRVCLAPSLPCKSRNH